MNSGLLRLCAADVVLSLREMERWSPTTAPRADARAVVGLLLIANNKANRLLTAWKGRVPDMETFEIEAQDIQADEQIYFEKVDEVHDVKSSVSSPVEPGYLRMTLDCGKGEWSMDVAPDETFAVVTT